MIKLILLDTGVRLSELVGMKMNAVHIQDGKIKVWGKGAKEREVVFQNTTKRYLHRYEPILHFRYTLVNPAKINQMFI